MEIAHPERGGLNGTPHQRSTGPGESVEETHTGDDDGGNGVAVGRLRSGKINSGKADQGRVGD